MQIKITFIAIFLLIFCGVVMANTLKNVRAVNIRIGHVTAVTADRIQLETGDYILLETGDYMLKE